MIVTTRKTRKCTKSHAMPRYKQSRHSAAATQPHSTPDKAPHHNMNLREISKDRILQDMIRAVNPQTGAGWKALIVDFESMRILSAACKMYDIMEENVTSMYMAPNGEICIFFLA